METFVQSGNANPSQVLNWLVLVRQQTASFGRHVLAQQDGARFLHRTPAAGKAAAGTVDQALTN